MNIEEAHHAVNHPYSRGSTTASLIRAARVFQERCRTLEAELKSFSGWATNARTVALMERCMNYENAYKRLRAAKWCTPEYEEACMEPISETSEPHVSGA